MLLSDLIKKEVLDIKANRVGYIVDVDLNIAMGTISHFELKMGVFKKVPLTPDKIAKVGEKVILKITREEAEGKPVGASVQDN